MPAFLSFEFAVMCFMFGWFGVIVESFWTMNRELSKSLKTESNGWSFIMFFTGMPLLLYVGKLMLVAHWPFFVRGVVYAAGFFAAELIWGGLVIRGMLKAKVPWDYRPHPEARFGGLIRRDYAIPWAILGLLVEWIFGPLFSSLAPAFIRAIETIPPFQLYWPPSFFG